MPGSRKMVGLFVKNLLSQSSRLSNFDVQLPLSYASRRKDKTWGFSGIFQARPHKSLETRKDHFTSVQFSHSAVSYSLRPHELQHARPPCPPPTPGVHSNSCLSSQWCHPAISSSVIPFFSCPQSLPATGSFPMSQLFAWGGQSFGVQLQHQSFQWTPRTNLL